MSRFGLNNAKLFSEASIVAANEYAVIIHRTLCAIHSEYKALIDIDHDTDNSFGSMTVIIFSVGFIPDERATAG